MNSLILKFKHFYYRFRPQEDFYGKDFKRIFAFLLESRNWSPEKIAEYKFSRIKALLLHAEKNVPYYREFFKREGIASQDIKSFEDFAKLPILTKQNVRDNQEKLKADNFQQYHPIRTETSGTTGKFTALYRSRYHEAFRQAVFFRFLNEFGFNFRDSRININYPHSPETNSPIYYYNRIQNLYSVNICHLMAGRFQKVYDAIKDIKAKLIWAHPNILVNFACYIVENNLPPIEVPYIATYAETIYPQTRKILSRAFPAKYYEYYGNRENSIGAWGFSDGSFFEMSEYCHLEIMRSSSIEGYPQAGDIVSTSLHNYAFPLIRYDCGDIGWQEGYKNSEIPYPAVKLIGGRGKDFLLTRDGLFIPYFLPHLEHNNFDRIKYYQMIQANLDELIMKFIPKDNYNHERDARRLTELVEEALVHKFKIRLELVDEIDYTRSGKAPAFISRLADEYLEKLEV